MPSQHIAYKRYRVKAGDKKARADFWDFIAVQASLSEGQRLVAIQDGVSPAIYKSLVDTFVLRDAHVAALLNTSLSTLERRLRESKPLDLVASERLDRIATVTHLAEEVFADREAAAKWMSSPNTALGGSTPIMLCKTEIGATQVKRVLHALEWGGAA